MQPYVWAVNMARIYGPYLRVVRVGLRSLQQLSSDN